MVFLNQYSELKMYFLLKMNKNMEKHDVLHTHCYNKYLKGHLKEKSLFWLIILEAKFEVSFKTKVRQYSGK